MDVCLRLTNRVSSVVDVDRRTTKHYIFQFHTSSLIIAHEYTSERAIKIVQECQRDTSWNTDF